MDTDLREQIAQVFTPEAAQQLAAAVGMDESQGKDFIAAAVPTLLAALLQSTSSGPGAKALSDAVSNADVNTLERLRSALAAHDLTPLSEGVNALAPVLGASVRDNLANGLATLFDAPVEAAAPALGAVEQATVGVLGQQDPSAWSDGDALRNYLVSQKGGFLSAVPAALAGLVGVATSAAPKAVPAPPVAPPPPAQPQVPPPPAAAPSRAAPPPPPQAAGGFPTGMVLLIVVVIVAVAAYFYWTRTQPKPAAGFNAPSTEFAFARPQAPLQRRI